jgi:ribosomal protein S18 acetylase RimI-like enzyme
VQTVEIRYANINDAKDLGAIQSASWRAAYKGIVPDDIHEAYTPEVREKAFEGFLAAGESLNALALCDGRPAGWTCFEKCRDEDAPPSRGEVWGIYVSPDYWRQGIGSELLGWTVGELKKRGFASVSLWVFEDNADARAFYEKHGLKADGAKKELELGRKLILVRYIREIA